MNEPQKCPQCGVNLPADAPAGVCPQCVLKMALGSQPDKTRVVARPDERGASPSVDEIAKLFPQLEILSLLGQGGMGVVYKARQPQLDRFVALKLMLPEYSRDPAFAERFTREARALAKLNHPNIVAVYEFGQAGEYYYFIMEFVDGSNLRQLERAQQLTPQEAMGVIPKICDALQFAHDEGIVHRDIKPENILMDKKGRVKIADFGLAKLINPKAEDRTLTGTNYVMGTLNYMAPEQMEKPLTVDHRADIYSLGVVFYEMLTGELPMGRFQPPSAKVQMDVRLDEVVLRSMERDVERRYQHVSEVKTAVENVKSTQPQAAPVSPVVPKTQADYRQQDAKEILTVVMTVLMGLSGLGVVAALIGLARVFFPAFRTDMEIGQMGSLGRDAWEFSCILILSVMALFLLPKAKRQGRDRLARINAISLVIVGTFLTYVCARHWFGLAVPFWLGGIYSVAAFVCWIILRGRDVKAAFGAAPSAPAAASTPPQSAQPTPVNHLNNFLGFFMTPQPGYAKSVGIPMLILTGLWMVVMLAVTLLVKEENHQTLHLITLGAGLLGIPLGLLVLSLRWAVRRGKQPPVAGSGNPTPTWVKVLAIGLCALVAIPVVIALLVFGLFTARLKNSGPTDSGPVESVVAVVPRLGTITNGIGANFTVPAGQVATFEIVTRKNGATVALPSLAAYVIAPPNRSCAGTFLLAPEIDGSGPYKSWRIDVVTDGGGKSSSGVWVPASLEAAIGGALGLGLEPNRETIHWMTLTTDDSLPDNGLAGLRVRTQAHGIKAGMPGSAGASGTADIDWRNNLKRHPLTTTAPIGNAMDARFEAGQDRSQIPTTTTPGRQDYAFKFAGPANYAVVVWVEFWKDGKLEIVPDFDERYTSGLHQKINLALRLTMMDGDVASVESAGKTRFDWAMTDHRPTGIGTESTGMWRSNPFKDCDTRTTTWDKPHDAEWHPQPGQTITLLALCGYRTKDIGAFQFGWSEASLLKGWPNAVILVRARFDPVSPGEQREGPVSKAGAHDQTNKTMTFAQFTIGKLIGADLSHVMNQADAHKVLVAATSTPENQLAVKKMVFDLGAGGAWQNTATPEELITKLEAAINDVTSGKRNVQADPGGPLMIGANGPELHNGAIKKLKLSKLQADEINRIMQSVYRDYLALERRHSKISKDDKGRTVVTIEPFSEECQALAKRLVAEFGGLVDFTILPEPRVGALPFQIFRWGGEQAQTITMWKTDGKYFVEDKRGTFTFNMSGPKFEELPEQYRLFWREE